MVSFKEWLSIALSFHLLPVVSADTYNLGGLVAASVVAFVLLVVIIAMLILGTLWNDWYPAVQKARGKVKVPRDFGKKKEDTRLRCWQVVVQVLSSLTPRLARPLPLLTEHVTRLRGSADGAVHMLLVPGAVHILLVPDCTRRRVRAYSWERKPLMISRSNICGGQRDAGPGAFPRHRPSASRVASRCHEDCRPDVRRGCVLRCHARFVSGGR
ncbi:uncharacterized protein LOC112567933 isoform X2 [Pomacea canaliculata]|uniref:uncharacterized protein LOC112567933 isoform X2 n=1 Tax=Pomacea canaliculata TaxID=400727 RepID=UPI000D72BA02|nr:uncharacterized protein LOC112567933 isoform X2 [Pomacea canaliculata]